MSNAVSWQVNASPLHVLPDHKVCHFLQSLTSFLHVRKINPVNSVPCIERHHTIEPFILPKQLLSLGFSLYTLTGKDCLPLLFVNTQPALSLLSQIAE